MGYCGSFYRAADPDDTDFAERQITAEQVAAGCVENEGRRVRH